MAAIRPIALGKVFPVRNCITQSQAHGQWLRTSKTMKFQPRILLCCLALQAGLARCLAHDNKTVHPKITASAAQSSVGLQNFLSDACVDTDGLETDLLIAGSIYEDIPFTRGFNHFYDPTKHPAIGLTDGFDWWAYPSFRWATEDLTQFSSQSYPWRLVRAYELDALTNSSQVVRQNSLNLTMFCLGHVLHLNQDLTVPAHVRNDNHGLTLEHGVRETFIMWTEIYGRDHYADNPQWFTNQSHGGWSWWQNTAGFQKLEDFWNRDMLRTDGVDALKAEARGDVNLGLSEFCNGNFISEDATYKECGNSSKHTFSYPSLDGTTYSQMRVKELDNVLLSSLHPVYLNNGHLARRIYLKKEHDGIVVTNHCVMSYLGVALAAKGPTPRLSTLVPIQRVSVSLDDTNVLQEYHEKLIPKAIEYSAGILDYFFRGTFTFQVSGNESESDFTLKNTSGQDFSGGAFFLLQETDGLRTLLRQYPLADLVPNGILADGGSVNFTYAGAATEKYLCFYQGTIGWTNNEALDLVDAGISVAIPLPPPITVTANPLWTDSGRSVTSGQTLMVSASGTWYWREPADANGTNDNSVDVFLAGANHGSLIAYVGTYPPYDDSTGANRWGDETYFPQSAGNGYWFVGENATITTDRTGELWFLINDDAVSEETDDNSGFLEVTLLIKQP